MPSPCQYCRTDDGRIPALPATVHTPAGTMCRDCAAEYRQWANEPAYAGPNDSYPDGY